MDKGLIKIKELNKELEGLNIEKTQNDASIREEVEKNSILEEEIFDLGKEIETKINAKTKFENAPKNRKKEKKKTLALKLLSYITISAFIAFICLIFKEVFAFFSVLPSLVVATIGIAIVYSVAIPMEFEKINKKYPIGNIPELEQEIEELRRQLSNSVSNKNKSDNKLENLQKLRKYQEAIIQNILQEKVSIETLRAKVIEEYCNNNPELEEKIDKAYDEDVKAKEKVKTK